LINNTVIVSVAISGVGPVIAKDSFGSLVLFMFLEELFEMIKIFVFSFQKIISLPTDRLRSEVS
jgi:hypothetical protein